MRNYIFAALLLILCVQLQAHGFTYNKEAMINQSKLNYKEGTACLMQANNWSALIPNLADREHFKAVITGAIASCATQDFKGKILTVGLTLLSSLATDSYDQYCNMRTKLYQADYHFAMSIFYNQMSLNVPDKDRRMDSGTNSFFQAIDRLTMCILVTECIGDADQKRILHSYYTELRDDLIDIYTRAENKLTYALYEEAMTFYENVDEICSEIEDEDIRIQLCIYTGAAVESLASSLRVLKDLDCWPDLSEWKRLMWVSNEEMPYRIPV